MEERLGERVIGQEEARQLLQTRSDEREQGLRDPIVRLAHSFFSVRPVSVRQKLRALAEFLFDDERAMIRARHVRSTWKNMQSHE